MICLWIYIFVISYLIFFAFTFDQPRSWFEHLIIPVMVQGVIAGVLFLIAVVFTVGALIYNHCPFGK